MKMIQKLLLSLALVAVPFVYGNPQGGVVRQGAATFSSTGPNLTINAAHNTFINWQSFNIGAGETTTFIQPNSRSVVWNRINDANPSQILGNLNANGFVVLMNNNGFYFGKDSVIKVGGFLATTTPILQSSFGSGSFWQFNGPPPLASIINYGQITTGPGGSIFLVAEKVENHGVLTAPDGTIGLYAGKEVYVSDRPDGRGLSASVQLPIGSVDNTGKLVADAGTIALQARVVNQSGLIQADSIREKNGVIELYASDSINLGETSILSAKGGGEGKSNAGQIEIKADQSISDVTGSKIDVSGGVQGGNGGVVEVSAPKMSAIHSTIDGEAQAGSVGGKLIIDPKDIVIGSSGSDGIGSGTVGSTANPDTLYLDVNSAFQGFSSITLQATHNIQLADGTIWNLNDSTGLSTPGSMLTLEAGQDIVFGSSAKIIGGAGWSVTLAAGSDFTSPLHVVSGQGGIYVNGGPIDDTGLYPRLAGAIQTADGNIDLRAGNEVIVGSGYIRTQGGGNISIQTLSGDVDAGINKNSFIFNRLGAQLDPNGIGGIATQSGGNVTINSGHDIISLLPTIGCYGVGNVSLSAQNDIIGRFLLTKGSGTLNANDIGHSGSAASLALVSGSWTAIAQQDIYLNEVYNPNGSLNSTRQSTGARIPFQFNYAPDAAVTLNAGNSVQLLGDDVAHTSVNPDRLPIYAPQLTISAGKGGVVLGNDLVLYPSALGGLHISTTDGGTLRSTDGDSFRIIMSDSDSPIYSTFVDGHSRNPLHFGHEDPVGLNISGNIENVRLQVPKEAIINVAGDTVNFFFTGQNLTPEDNTQINVGGNIRNRDDLTRIDYSTVPALGIFGPKVTGRPDLNIGASLIYDRVNHKLIFVGKMTQEVHDFLMNPLVKVFDENGQPVLDTKGVQVMKAVSFLTQTQADQLYYGSQDIPAFPTKNGGFFIGGPGKLTITANNMDLGITAGVRSYLTALNPDLARFYSKGADIDILLRNDLAMTSSQIASLNGGSIKVIAGGRMDIGSQTQFTSDDTPKGIYTGNGGSVTVQADQDIIVNGSRIGSYDGGDVSVTSVHGNVDAGSGAKGLFHISIPQYNPDTDTIETRSDMFFGSGIVAMTRKSSSSTVGNISISAGGDVISGAGGIAQISFNRSSTLDAFLSIRAGYLPNGDPNLGSSAPGDINASGSGAIGYKVSLKARRNITGLIVARDLTAVAEKSINANLIASGHADASAGDSISGLIVGGEGLNVSAESISGTLISNGATSASGDASAASIGAFQGVVASAGPKITDDAETLVSEKPKFEATSGDGSGDGTGNKRPLLAKATGRVTVVLPNK